MFDLKRKNKAERVAGEAWDNLVSAVESAGDTARSVGRRTSDKASDLAGSAQAKVRPVADEAWTRAHNALDALAGRKPSKPWGWIAAAVVAGVAVGYAVAVSAPKAISAAMDRGHEDELTPASTGTMSTPTTTGMPSR